MSLKQPSRSLIKHISLTVPSFHDILEGFADLVRLGLRYCWGLQTFTIALPTFVPEDRYTISTGTNVYANAFHILRWLPQETKVILDGGATDEIRKIVEENTKMAENLDKVWHHLVRYPDNYFDDVIISSIFTNVGSAYRIVKAVAFDFLATISGTKLRHTSYFPSGHSKHQSYNFYLSPNSQLHLILDLETNSDIEFLPTASTSDAQLIELCKMFKRMIHRFLSNPSSSKSL
jgi:hypothetical protein